MLPKIILLRHGQSIWNQQNLFTGWVDIPLSEKGVQEAMNAGEKLKHIPIDVIFTSTLVRAHTTLILALLKHDSKKIPVFLHEEGGKLQKWSEIYSEKTLKTMIPVHMAWELNERMYGRLQGLNKAETAEKYGAEQVHIWRRSYDVAPPDGESLEMTAARTIPYFQKKIIPCLEKGQNVFISAHGNSLRSIVMHMESLTKDQVLKLEIPTGEALIYSYKQGKWHKE